MNLDRTKKYRLSQDVAVMFRGNYEVKAAKGTRLDLITNADGLTGDALAIPPNLADAGNMGKAGTWSIFGHDSKYFYIWAPKGSWEIAE